MKTLNKIFTVFLFVLIIASISVSSSKAANFYSAKSDSQEVLKQYSLFSEYHKNREFESALPFGWKVIELDPEMMKKWIYYKMEDVLWYLHDSSQVSIEEKKAIKDTILYFYDLALQYYPDDKEYFQSRKAFVSEVWLNLDPEIIIGEYEKAVEINPRLSSYYYDRLGQLYKANISDENDYKSKAIDIFTLLNEREPDNPRWNSELESLVDNIEELVALARKSWELNKDDLAKAYKYADLAIKANDLKEALIPLEFLISKSPETINYWKQIASVYQKLDMINKAEESYKKLIQLEPGNRDHYLNLGIVYKDKGLLAAARIQYQKASELGNGWGLPIYYEGLLYEQTARSCTFDFKAKLVYQVAVDTYRRAMRIDPSVASQAQTRISALSGSVPTQEDYFFQGYKSGQTIPITGDCYAWIGKSVTVP